MRPRLILTYITVFHAVHSKVSRNWPHGARNAQTDLLQFRPAVAAPWPHQSPMRNPSLECRRKPVFWHGGLELMNVMELSFISCLYAGREFFISLCRMQLPSCFPFQHFSRSPGRRHVGASWVSMALTGTLRRCLLRSDFWGLYNLLSFLPSLFWFSNRVSHWSVGPGIHCITQAGLKLAAVLWPLPPRYWDYRFEVPHLEDSFHVFLSGPLFYHAHFALYESRFPNLFVLVYVCPEHYWPYSWYLLWPS